MVRSPSLCFRSPDVEVEHSTCLTVAIASDDRPERQTGYRWQLCGHQCLLRSVIGLCCTHPVSVQAVGKKCCDVNHSISLARTKREPLGPDQYAPDALTHDRSVKSGDSVRSVVARCLVRPADAKCGQSNLGGIHSCQSFTRLIPTVRLP